VGKALVTEQLEKFKSPELQRIAGRLTERYSIAFYHAQAALMEEPTSEVPQLIKEINFCAEEFLLNIEKLDYFTDYLRYDIIRTTETPYLLQQLERHLLTINTLKEADLCDSESMRRRGDQVFVTTVHKAKGLEFDNVIVSSVTKGIYPFYDSQTYDEQKEDARKLYVAITRAKRRIFISYYNLYHMTDRYGTPRTFSKGPSEFLLPIAHHFVKYSLGENLV
jgi:DNA helicase-2/ATP-dependent DNA helicase PcrA